MYKLNKAYKLNKMYKGAYKSTYKGAYKSTYSINKTLIRHLINTLIKHLIRTLIRTYKKVTCIFANARREFFMNCEECKHFQLRTYYWRTWRITGFCMKDKKAREGSDKCNIVRELDLFE